MSASNFRRHCLWALALTFVAVALGFYAVLQRSEQRGLERLAAQDLAAARAGYDCLEAGDTRLLCASLEPLLRDAALRGAFVARDRRKLYALAKPIFDGLKARYGITHFYFLEGPPQGACFLRVHAPGLFGDKVERHTYRKAVRDGGFGTGKELGQTAFALRAVHPWLGADHQTVIGYVELGEEIGHFLGRLKDQTGDDYALLLDKRKLDPMIWTNMRHSQGRASDWSDRPLYVLAEDTGGPAGALAWNGSLEKLPEDGRVLGLEWVNGACLLRGVFPVKDASGQRAGAVLLARDVTALIRTSRPGHVFTVLGLLLAALLVGLLAGWLLARTDGGVGLGGWRDVFGPLPKALARAVKELGSGG